VSTDIKQVPVRILGKEFVVGCRADEVDELTESARLLDRKMREVRDAGKVIGTERIAVMAALNMAHELVRRDQAPPSTVDPLIEERLRGLQERIDAVLAEEDRQLKI
jgi:cell division protein ZapA